ncbi:uncharacterized protein [Parasteatoda tepidariorum]|uniref:uncharacterized protein isoform X3 n=1 Tax=Parasteatoda tepidariorum TaxID=114398 RepID=UPI001C71FBF6|nr:U3-aranetoxin-Ce1a isoform X3 [Parasteatoda tepidariorum]
MKTLNFIKMKGILFLLFILCVKERMMTVNAKCPKNNQCGKGQACVQAEAFSGMNCKPYTEEGRMCSVGDAKDNDGIVYHSYPPCNPHQNLKCTHRNGRTACYPTKKG